MDNLTTHLATRGISYRLIEKDKLDLIFHNQLCVNFQNDTQKVIIRLKIIKNKKELITSYNVLSINQIKRNIQFHDFNRLLIWYENYLKSLEIFYCDLEK